MNTYNSIADVIIHKFLGGHFFLFISLVATYFFLFEFTNIGFWIWAVLSENFIDLFNEFEISVWFLIKFCITVLLTIIGVIVASSLSVFFSYFGLSLITMPLIYSVSWLYCSAFKPPSVLDKLLSYELQKSEGWKQLNKHTQSGNKFDLNILSKMTLPEDLFIRYMLEKDTIEYVSYYYKSSVHVFDFKIRGTNTALNFILRFFPYQIVGFVGGCSHGLADEIYCEKCYENAKDKQLEVEEFLKEYRRASKLSHDKKDKVLSVREQDLMLLNLSEPFSMSELRKKRNIALKQNHPDLAFNQTKQVQNFAKQQTQRILEAYSRLERDASR